MTASLADAGDQAFHVGAQRDRLVAGGAGWNVGQRLNAGCSLPSALSLMARESRKSRSCLEGLPGLRAEGSFRSYLFAIAYRQLCRHYRTKRNDRVDLTTISAVALDPSIVGLLAEREEMRLFLELAAAAEP